MAVEQIGDGTADGVFFPNTKIVFFSTASTAYGAAPSVAPVVQQSGTGNVSTGAAGSTTTVFLNTTYTGGVGSTAYTVGDIVLALKNYNLLKN